MADSSRNPELAADLIAVRVNGQSISVPVGTSVAAAVMRTGCWTLRKSVSGEPRGALCGMGICFECRVTIDGQLHQRSCQILCRAGLEILSDVV
jgi:aerobic-type carbon monoxide dehydrogenase small subunit (CoxS/CutS family)